MTVLQIWEETCVIWELAIQGWVAASDRREMGELICEECVKQTQGHAVHNHRVSANVCACGGCAWCHSGFVVFIHFSLMSLPLGTARLCGCRPGRLGSCSARTAGFWDRPRLVRSCVACSAGHQPGTATALCQPASALGLPVSTEQPCRRRRCSVDVDSTVRVWSWWSFPSDLTGGDRWRLQSSPPWVREDGTSPQDMGGVPAPIPKSSVRLGISGGGNLRGIPARRRKPLWESLSPRRLDGLL